MIDRIKHYQIKRKIGTGGMATVYEAVDTRRRTPVALKVLHPHLADQPTYVARFVREAQMARGVDSPHIVRVLDHGQDQGLHYLAQEYVDGVTLQQFSQQHGSLSLQQALDVTYQTALALQEANHHGIVHRDIKPQNIMITPAGSIKVMDFGIARTSLMESMTMTGMYMGTPQYSSPEQAGGDAVDIRSDIYSLGVVLYQLLTGAVPFQADTPQALLLRVMRGNPVPVSSLRVDLPKPLSDLVDKMLVRDPAGRFQSPEELLSALRPLLGQRPEDTRAEMATMLAPITARQTATAVAPRQTAPRRNGSLYLAAGGAIILLALLGMLIWKPGAGGQPATPTAGVLIGVPATDLPAAPVASPTLDAITMPTATTGGPASSTVESATATSAPATAAPSPTATARPPTASPTPTATSKAARTPTATSTPRSPTATLTSARQVLAAPVLTGPGDGETVTGRVALSWQPVAGSSGYVVQTRSDRAGQTDWRSWQAGQNTSLAIPFSADPDYFSGPGTVYYWRAVALNAAGQPGSFSSVRRWVYQVESQPAPAQPPAATPTPPPLPDTPTPPPLPDPPTPPPLPDPPTPTPAG